MPLAVYMHVATVCYVMTRLDLYTIYSVQIHFPVLVSA